MVTYHGTEQHVHTANSPVLGGRDFLNDLQKLRVLAQNGTAIVQAYFRERTHDPTLLAPFTGLPVKVSIQNAGFKELAAELFADSAP